jgi:C-terminal processing protease CtpA/Prc
MKKRFSITFLAISSVLLILACNTLSDFSASTPTQTAAPTITTSPRSTSIPLPQVPISPGEANPDEPLVISGSIPYSSPFFLNTISEPFVLLEDQAGFVNRDKEFEFPLAGQVIGPVLIHEDQTLSYSLALPSVPQGTFVDVSNNGKDDTGVQVFAVAYWSNTWGGPFLEPRDGTGWSTAYASTITDALQKYEITGGILIIWAPDDQQLFPLGFGEDGLLFTEDDPIEPVPAGYSIVDLNEDPFRIYKESQPKITLHEGDLAVNDYSNMSYIDSFEALFEKVSQEYPFTHEKGIDWARLYDEYAPRVSRARDGVNFYRAIRDFTYAIPDAHVGVSFNAEVFFQERGGSFGLVLAELSDGRVIVVKVLPDTPGETAGIMTGAQVIRWNDRPVQEVIEAETPYLGPYSTDHHKRLEQLIFITRVPPSEGINVEFQNPGENQPRQVTMTATVEYESLFDALPFFSLGALDLPVEVKVLDESGLAYIRITTFSDDYRLMAKLWERHIEKLIENDIPGLILDLRLNSGGSSGLAMDFAGYFFDEEIILSRRSYYNENLGEFEYTDYPTRVRPAPIIYEAPIAILVSPYCVSACEGFANALKYGGRAMTIGHYPTAGAFGEVGRGQYKLPGDLSLQFPTGRPETLDGNLLIEGEGVPLDISVPVTEESALNQVDTALEAAIQALLDEIK